MRPHLGPPARRERRLPAAHLHASRARGQRQRELVDLLDHAAGDEPLLALLHGLPHRVDRAVELRQLALLAQHLLAQGDGVAREGLSLPLLHSLWPGLREGHLRAEAKAVRLLQAGDQGLQEGVELHAGRHGVHSSRCLAVRSSTERGPKLLAEATGRLCRTNLH